MRKITSQIYKAIRITMVVMAGLLAACGGGTPTTTTPPTQPSIPITAPTAANTPMPGTVATTLDPCKLVPPEEASRLAGTSFEPGVSSTDVGGLKRCVYGSLSANVFTVEVVQVADKATAQSQLAQFMAELQTQIPQLAANGLKVTELPNLADGAIFGEASLPSPVGNVNGSALGVAKGTVFFGFSDIVMGGPAPTSEALQAEAATVLGRLP